MLQCWYKVCQNGYIKFLDADDLINNKTTSTLMNFLEKEKNIVLAYGLQRKVKDITKKT